MKRLGLAILAVALCMVATRPAMAQGTLRYGIQAGLLMPMGDYNTADKPGWVAGAGATYWLPGTGNIGVRADASYSQTSHDFNVSGNTKIFGAMASFVYELMPASAPARLILNAGVGLYNVKLGTGTTRLVVASRFTSVSTSTSSTTFLPITVGLSFGKK